MPVLKYWSTVRGVTTTFRPPLIRISLDHVTVSDMACRGMTGVASLTPALHHSINMLVNTP
ncbi:hypothetical protein [Salmonella enterica]|uniref:hypothetical protein n=1 Tax=Salmonella enterica TaxID=28901 RepID=UPI00398C708D